MIICGKCSVQMMLLSLDPIDSGIPVITHAADGSPYTISWGDRLTCPKCKATVIANFGDLTRHYEDGFKAYFLAARKYNPYTMEVK